MVLLLHIGSFVVVVLLHIGSFIVVVLLLVLHIVSFVVVVLPIGSLIMVVVVVTSTLPSPSTVHPTWVSQVGGDGGKDGGASELLHHLPLLRPTNTEAKLQYLSIIPKVLAQALASAGSQPGALEDARQLLSYSLLHPAINGEERRALTHWLTALHSRLPRNTREGYPSSTPTTTPTTASNNNNNRTSSSNSNNSGNKPRWPTEAPTVPDTGQTRHFHAASALAPWDDVAWCSSSSNGVGVGSGGCVSGVGTVPGVVGSGGSSGGVGPGTAGTGEAPQSPNNSATSSSRSSGGDSNAEEPCHPHPGMRDVGLWLKSLRLHKYAPLLCHLTYDELLSLDEATLEAQGVTKGARHKIVLSIQKLKERHKQLEQIEKEVVSGSHLLPCLNELKSIILTPFPPLPSIPSSSTPSQDSNISVPVNSISSSSTTVSSSISGSNSFSPPFSSCSSSTACSTISPSVSGSSTTISPSMTSSVITSTNTTITSSSSSSSSLSTSASSSACSLRGEEREGGVREDVGEAGGGGERGERSEMEGDGSMTNRESDLPSQFTRVMGKVCTQLLVSVRAEEECVSGFLGLVERCLTHEAFTPTHSRRLTSWRHQVLRVARPLPPRAKDGKHGRRWSQQLSGDTGFWGGSFRGAGARVAGSGGNQRHAPLPPGLLAKGFPPPQPHPLFPLPPTVSLGGLMSPRNSLPGLPSLGVPGLLSPQQFLAKRPSLQETPSELRPHITLQRTRSAPSRPHQLPLTAHTRPHPPSTSTTTLGPDLRISGSTTTGGSGLGAVTTTSLDPHYPHTYQNLSTRPPSSASPDPADNDITDRLESLCLSVTEHALG
ncbi:hypothetical protein Pmani_034126 [Petrolisthes manimaculis]|uniref:SAM domain-containing protein n=1 Tax=Petrolisthes manimaculis TaxID=1843537 RepID=A0AAE1NPF8_9EUCA|nr:hypothetical protein Pmani_034126 [Petrolisthes manimaculis]